MDRINQTALSLVHISLKFATFEQFSFNPTFSSILYHVDSFELYSFKEKREIHLMEGITYGWVSSTPFGIPFRLLVQF